jgi:hypothetical protein
MPTLSYRLLNVFTRDAVPLTGNPLCVFEDGGGLSDQTMQQLARQFNLSETTFVPPATTASAHARVRIFTPGYEMSSPGILLSVRRRSAGHWGSAAIHCCSRCAPASLRWPPADRAGH